MKEYETKDEFDDEDRAFFEAHTVLLTGVGDLEKAAVTVTEYALRRGDRGALAFFLARFADFVDAGKIPPMPMLKGLRDVFNAFRGGASMDDAFTLSGDGKGRPKNPMLKREWARTNANLVAHYVNSGYTLEVAIEKAFTLRAAPLQGMRGDSESKIKRDYLKFRRLKK